MIAPTQISVIIPSYNESENIEGALNCLLNQDTRLDFEIIVVDSSKDGTADIVRKSVPPVRLVHCTNRLSCGEAKNRGVDLARGDKILFTDADGRVPPHWVETMARYLDDYDFVGGAVISERAWNIGRRVADILEFIRCLPAKRGGCRKNSFYIAGLNSGYRRKVFEKHRFLSGRAQDLIFNHKLLANGKTSFFDGRLIVRHVNKGSFDKLFRFQVKLGNSGYRWRKLTGRNSVSMRVPGVMIVTPLLKLTYILWHFFYQMDWRNLFFCGLAAPLIILADGCWVYGFVSAARADRRLEGQGS